MFLTFVFGLMMFFGGSAAAQTTITGNVVAPCVGGYKPQVNDTFKFFVFSTVNDSQGKKAYFILSRNNKPICSVNLHYSQQQLIDYLNSKGVKGKLIWNGKVSNAGNFTEALKTGDLMTLDYVNDTTFRFTIARNKKSFGTATLAAVKEK